MSDYEDDGIGTPREMFQKPNKIKPFRAAVIGLGRIGFEFGLDKNRPQPASHFHCYEQLGANIAVCDIDKEKIGGAPLSKNLKMVATDYRELFEEFKPEIVSICTPTNTHLEITVAAANCPSVKTIFLEKPIAQSLGEADAIMRTCRINGKRLAVNYVRRWSKTYSRLKNQIPPKVLMDMIGIHPGPLVRTGTHMIDLFNMIGLPLYSKCGKVGGPSVAATMFDEDFWDNVEVQAFGAANLSEYMKETEDLNINGHIKYNSVPNVTATIFGELYVQPKTVVFELDVITHDQRWSIKENGRREEYAARRASKHYVNLDEYFRLFLRENNTENMLLNAITQLVETLNSSNSTCRATANCEGIDARRALQLALALHYSATHGNTKVKLKEVPYEYEVRSY